jgi:hypothetical protein
MFNNLGIQWAGTLLGCLAAIMVPIPVCFYLYGAKLRAKSRYSPTMMVKPPPEDDSTEEEGDIFVAPPSVPNGPQTATSQTLEKIENNKDPVKKE